MTDRTEEQERVEEALEWLEVNAKFGTLGHTADVNAKVVRDHLTRLRDQRDEAREALDIFASLDRLIERKMDLTEARDPMDNVRVEYRGETYWLKKYHLETARRALEDADESHPTDVTAESHDESEGRGGGEAEQKLERVADLLEHVDGAIGDSGQATYWLREAHRHVGDLLARPDPSEGEVGCDHENTVLDDNVEWCPDCRRVMPEDAEDAEDDGRGEGRFRKRPVGVDAFRWEGDIDALYDWLERTGFYDREQLGEEGIWTEGDTLQIDTVGGTMTAQEGDWIICGVEGEYYPCKPDIFRQAYEPATEEDRVEMLRETMDDDTFFEAWEEAEWKLARARTTIRKLKKELTRYYEAENRGYREMQAPTHSDADPSGVEGRRDNSWLVARLKRIALMLEHGDDLDDAVVPDIREAARRLRRTEDAGEEVEG